MTFLTNLPLAQVMVVAFAIGVADGASVDEVFDSSLLARITIFGAEKWKPLAKKYIVPSLLVTAEVATLVVPSSFTTSIESFADLVRVFPGYLQSINAWLAQYLK